MKHHYTELEIVVIIAISIVMIFCTISTIQSIIEGSDASLSITVEGSNYSEAIQTYEKFYVN